MKTPQRFWRYFAIAGCLCVLGLDKGTTTDAEDEAKLKRINKQLDEILEVQATILKRYDELMEELRVVKVRASQ